MKINEIKPKMGDIDVIVDVLDLGPVREFNKFGKQGRVATAIVKDETGDCKLSLWNEDIDKVKPGDRIHLTNGYAGEWQGEIQLTSGRNGKIEVIAGEAPKEDKPEMEGAAVEEDVK